MTNQEKIKNWIAHWEAVRDLAAKDGDYPKWEAAEALHASMKAALDGLALAMGCDDSELCPIEIDRRPSETKVGAVLVEVS